MPDLLNFSELTSRSLMLDYRIYIFGVDVTPYVLEGDISWTYADKDGNNTANFTLNNALDNFIITTANLGIRVNSKGEYEQTADGGIFRPRDLQEQTSTIYSERAKRRIIEFKQAINSSTGGEVYSLGLRNICIHRNDPVRIFTTNPTNPLEWMIAFTGYIDYAQKSTNWVNGQSTLSVTCYDIRQQMMRMRVQLSPVMGNPVYTEAIINDTTNFFQDLVFPDIFNDPSSLITDDRNSEENLNLTNRFANKTYESVVSTLLTGTTNPEIMQYDELGFPDKSPDVPNGKNGVGQMTKGYIFYYDCDNPPESPTKNGYYVFYENGVEADRTYMNNRDLLNTWYNLQLFGYFDVNNRTFDIEPLDIRAVDYIGKETRVGGEFSPDRVRFHMFLPLGGTKTADGLTTYAFAEAAEKIDFASRYEILKQFSDNIEYQFFISGTGDVCFEFPFYDFVPSDFKYSNLLTVDQFLLTDSIIDEQGDIPTALTVTGSMVSQNEDSALNTSDLPNADNIPRILLINKILSARFGIDNQSHHFPTVLNKDNLVVLTKLEYQKRLSLTTDTSLDTTFRPWLLPNKPVYHKNEERIGIISSVTHRLELFKSADTSIVLRYVKKRRNDGQFAFLDGSETASATYARAWDNSQGKDLEIGVQIIDPVNTNN